MKIFYNIHIHNALFNKLCISAYHLLNFLSLDSSLQASDKGHTIS